MEKIITNWRCWALLIIAAAAFLFILATPQDTDPNWMGTLLLGKFLAAVLALTVWGLYGYWKQGGKIDGVEAFVEGEE